MVFSFRLTSTVCSSYQVYLQKAVKISLKFELFQRNLTYFYLTIVIRMFLVQFADQVAGLVDCVFLLALLLCPM